MDNATGSFDLFNDNLGFFYSLFYENIEEPYTNLHWINIWCVYNTYFLRFSCIELHRNTYMYTSLK